MDKEIVGRVIEGMSAGNGDLRQLLGEIYVVARPVIDKLPNNQVGWLERRMMLAVSGVVQRRITAGELRSQKEGYWKTDKGKVSAQRLAEYMEKRRVKDDGGQKEGIRVCW